MVYYESVKVIINAPGLAEVIIEIVMRYHGFPNSIVSDWGSVFNSKFWSLHATSLWLSEGSLLFSILKLMARPRGKAV